MKNMKLRTLNQGFVIGGFVMGVKIFCCYQIVTESAIIKYSSLLVQIPSITNSQLQPAKTTS